MNNFVEKISYYDNGTDLEAFVAYPGLQERRPLVVLCHAWRGRDDFICQKAEEVAKWGYVGFAIDMYGKDILGKSNEENRALKKPFIDHRDRLQRRVLKGYEVGCSLPYVDRTNVAAVGFGFGGICALDLARSGVDLKGVISVYGHFDPPPSALVKSIRARVLILHGYKDPVTSPDEYHRFEKEMADAKVDWQAHIYGDAMHAFAAPLANDPASGIQFNPLAALRAWRSVRNFLDEIFPPSI